MDEMKALSDVFNLRPEMFMQGMRSLENVRQSDQNKLQQQQLANQQATLQNQFAQENNPIRQEQAKFGLMKDRAMFPGDLAESQGKVVKGQNAGNYTPDQIPQVLTHAASFAMSPGAQTPALHGAMKSMLRNAYVPEIMDNWTPQQFAENLPKMLESYSKLLPKNVAASNLQDDKLAAMERIAAERAAITKATAEAKKAAGSKARTFATGYDKLKSAVDRVAALTSEMASLDPDDPLVIQYQRMKEALIPQAQEEINRKANPTGFEQDPATKEWRVRSPVQLGAGSPATAGRPERQAAQQFPNAPTIGTVKGGYTYTGGDPSNQSSWKK